MAGVGTTGVGADGALAGVGTTGGFLTIISMAEDLLTMQEEEAFMAVMEL